MITQKSDYKSVGFTLIELLIVIGVASLLAILIVWAINPLEQLARSRDSGRFNQITQLGHGLSNYASGQGGSVFVSADGNWLTNLKTANDIIGNLKSPAGGTACTVNNSNGFCYTTFSSNSDAAVWTPAESQSNLNKAACSGGTPYAVIIYIESQGKSGLDCLSSASGNPTATDVLK